MRLFPALLILAPLLAGCASLSQEECATGDWTSIGSVDANQGHPKSRLADHQKACKRYDITPDAEKYLAGYKTGLGSYCTPANGFQVGRNGYSYHKICPAESEPVFLKGYLRGEVLHETETQIVELDSQVQEIDEQITSSRMIKSSDERRAELSRLHGEKDRLERERWRLEREKNRALLDAELFLQRINPDI
ncbi:Protein of unknown function [Cohaesibacter sp. ES.047]|uniref:DUF2799 domain-containing protein n=1 Tax=Cohaesibacter sp. ES.047 TaxID=1798205 RepID=UPI000BC03A9F|nr:DUF2799 domain-containing protein [Cohaesibacter sp. ES.047]SNY90329.1 Protein of unknown function [Cohaesibacter sp. ES.047]